MLRDPLEELSARPTGEEPGRRRPGKCRLERDPTAERFRQHRRGARFAQRIEREGDKVGVSVPVVLRVVHAPEVEFGSQPLLAEQQRAGAVHARQVHHGKFCAHR